MQPHLQPVPSWPLATAASGTLSPAVTDRQQSGVCFRLQLDGFLQLNNFLVRHGIKTWFRSLNFFTWWCKSTFSSSSSQGLVISLQVGLGNQNGIQSSNSCLWVVLFLHFCYLFVQFMLCMWIRQLNCDVFVYKIQNSLIIIHKNTFRESACTWNDLVGWI